MSIDTRIPPVEVTGVTGAAVKMFARRLLGEVPTSAGVLWNNPAVMKDAMGIGRKVEGWKDLDRTLASYAHMAAAAYIGCSACLDFNYFKAHNEGLDEAKIREVPRWRESSAFSPLERRVMAYAEAMCATPVTVTDEQSAELLHDLGPAALIELSARVAFMNLSARMNIALGLTADGFADACGLPPLAARPTAAASDLPTPSAVGSGS